MEKHGGKSVLKFRQKKIRKAILIQTRFPLSTYSSPLSAHGSAEKVSRTVRSEKVIAVDHQNFHVHLPISDVDVTAETYINHPFPFFSLLLALIRRQKCLVSRKSGTQMARYDLQNIHDKPNVDWVSRSTSTSQAGAQVSDFP